MGYIVIVEAWNGSYYLNEDLEFKEELSDNVVWDGDEWDEKSIENYIKDDAKENEYTYAIERLDD